MDGRLLNFLFINFFGLEKAIIIMAQSKFIAITIMRVRTLPEIITLY